METDKFSAYNPIIGFLFFMGAIFMGMFFIHPLFLCVSGILSIVYYLSLKGQKGLKLVGILLCVLTAITLLNPVFNMLGDTLLFTYLGGRRYTLEALYYGMATGAMFLSIMMWFACYNIAMTSDKFIYLFGRLIPAISLIFTMVLRLIPNYQKRANTITGARKCIGKSAGKGSRRELVKNASVVISVLAGWALEDAVVTADSMRSRGYGLKGRTSFCIYRFGKRDVSLLAIMLALISSVILCAVNGAVKVSYIPAVTISGMNGYSYFGITAYAVFLMIPSIMKISEEIKWRILRSGI